MKAEQINQEQTTKVCLEENQVFSFKKLQKIFITSGNLWITITGDSEDYIYGEGDIVKIPDGKHTVAQALGKTCFWF